MYGIYRGDTLVGYENQVSDHCRAVYEARGYEIRPLIVCEHCGGVGFVTNNQ